jgi:molecular chaperone GrpE (heat shock protein)
MQPRPRNDVNLGSSQRTANKDLMPKYETTSAREHAEHQTSRIAELEAALQASHAALHELLARLADIERQFTLGKQEGAKRALAELVGEKAAA